MCSGNFGGVPWSFRCEREAPLCKMADAATLAVEVAVLPRSELNWMRTRLVELNKEIDELRSDMDEQKRTLDAKVRRGSNVADELRNRIAKMKERNKKAESKMDPMRLRIAELECDLARMKKRRRSSASELMREQTKLLELQNEVENLNDTVKTLRRDLSRVNNELREEKKKNEDAAELHRALVSQDEKLKARFERAILALTREQGQRAAVNARVTGLERSLQLADRGENRHR